MKERRRHKAYWTHNTEYHFRDDVCVGVKDRKSRKWLAGHIALTRKMEGGVKFFNNGAVVPSLERPALGDALYFSYRTKDGDDRQIVTSRIEWIGRPAKADVGRYGQSRITRRG